MSTEGRHAHPNYCSGEDFVLEFRSFRYGFNSTDFKQRTELAAVELDLMGVGTLDEEEKSDLVQLVATGAIDYPVSSLGDYLCEQGDDVFFHRGECLIYWLRELVFRSAWRDLRVMEGQIDLAFDEAHGRFVYFPKGHRQREIGPPPHPSWAEVAYVKSGPD